MVGLSHTAATSWVIASVALERRRAVPVPLVVLENKPSEPVVAAHNRPLVVEDNLPSVIVIAQI